MYSALIFLAFLLSTPSGDNRLAPLAPKVQSAGTLVASLAKSGDASVELSPGLADHSVFFYERGVPLEVALNAVAWCLHASLTHGSSG